MYGKTLDIMFQEITEYYKNPFYLILFLIACVFLFLKRKSFRYSIFYPTCGIVLCLMIPYLYQRIYKTAHYWRFFWMIPLIMIIALAFTEAVSLLKLRILQIFAVFALLVVIASFGNNIFVEASYTDIQNVYKISDDTVKVCEYILSLDQDPLCVFPESIYCETRQYSPKIHQLYGRNAVGYGLPMTTELERLFAEMRSPEPDYDTLFHIASDHGCEFVVMENSEEHPSEAMQYYYQFKESISGYDIYQVSDFTPESL